ncbi:hypothetical protein [Bacillus cihuensis]|uniref:hypothetical protein n=1 Tax=Bacillus cihuensis TaxID=1208599 RepID=UPI00041DFAEC|nr:hypothetical protein [Bacillus cihuensis]
MGKEAEEFCLATKNGWAKLAGHSINVGQYQFSVVPLKNIFRVSEINSGAKILDVPVPKAVESNEDTTTFIEIIVGA